MRLPAAFLPVLLALLLPPAAGCGAEGGGGPGRIVVGTEAAYPPFEFVDAERRIVGFDVDLVRAAAREAGLEAEFVDQPFDGLIPGLRGGKYDAVVSAMTITPERAEQVAFTEGYYDAGQVIAVREGTTGIAGPADLRGKVVAVQANTTGHRQAEKAGAGEVRAFPSIEPAFMELRAGRADAVVNDEPTTLLYAREHGGIRVVGRPFTEEKYGIAVRREDGELLAKLNGGLRKVRASGEYDRIRAKWIGGK
ncbi:MAG: basic amino acid ABC transporter substrate-binding protein [Planctomycetaceae bacterium]|nr:basic amino acid ABC transporter substrate-binding protein [Planctomycetota bacterium]NUN51656.1 basic amino acid ABC transporter substrate-binding protein [Planctomycetaceae bacterium]